MSDLPIKAISIQQPWAWLIVNGFKDVENRTWPTKFVAPVAIHAGKKIDTFSDHCLRMALHPVTMNNFDVRSVLPAKFDTGGIVGIAEIHHCAGTSESDWFVGPHGFLIRNASPVPFIPCRGQLGFFDWRKALEVGTNV